MSYAHLTRYTLWLTKTSDPVRGPDRKDGGGEDQGDLTDLITRYMPRQHPRPAPVYSGYDDASDTAELPAACLPVSQAFAFSSALRALLLPCVVANPGAVMKRPAEGFLHRKSREVV